MKRYVSSLLAIMLLFLSLIPLTFAAESGSDTKAAVKSADNFEDLKDLSQEVKDKFDALIKAGVFSGLTDDTFGLDAKMNRAQFAKVAAIIFQLDVDNSLTTSSFSDVSADDPANSYALPYIEALKKAGLTNGSDSGGKMYNPSGPVSRQELAAFLIRGLGLDEDAQQAEPTGDKTVDDWAKGYVALALEKKLLTNQTGSTFGGKSSATRKMLALAAYAAKQIFDGNDDGGSEPGTSNGGGTSATPTTKPEPTQPPKGGDISPQGKKLLFITVQSLKDLAKEVPADNSIVNRLKDLGFRVTTIACDKFKSEKADGYDLIIVSSAVNEKYLKSGLLKDVAIPTVYLKHQGMTGLSLASNESYREYNIKSLTIADPKEKAAAGFSGDVQILADAKSTAWIQYGKPGKEAVKVATVPGKSDEAAIYYYNKGSHSDSGYEVKARISFFFYDRTTVSYDSTGSGVTTATENAWKLFDAIVLWTLQNG